VTAEAGLPPVGQALHSPGYPMISLPTLTSGSLGITRPEYQGPQHSTKLRALEHLPSGAPLGDLSPFPQLRLLLQELDLGRFVPFAVGFGQVLKSLMCPWGDD
jgi:hypothetical protein